MMEKKVKPFFEIMKQNNIKLKDLTQAQFERVFEKLSVGYSGYWAKPSTEEWLARFEDLEPTEEQIRALTPTEEETEE